MIDMCEGYIKIYTVFHTPDSTCN